MSGRNVKKQRDQAMRLLREGMTAWLVMDEGVRHRLFREWYSKSSAFFGRFALEEKKKQAYAQRNGVKP